MLMSVLYDGDLTPKIINIAPKLSKVRIHPGEDIQFTIKCDRTKFHEVPPADDLLIRFRFNFFYFHFLK